MRRVRDSLPDWDKVNAWRRALTSDVGPKSPTTRWVLFMISQHANPEGVAWPSVRLLSARTALSQRAVVDHIEAGVESGWIARRSGEIKGRGWRQNKYQLSYPKGVEVLSDVQQHKAQHLNGGSAPASRGAERPSRGAEPRSNEVLSDVHTKDLEDQGSMQRERASAPPATQDVEASRAEQLARYEQFKASLGRGQQS